MEVSCSIIVEGVLLFSISIGNKIQDFFELSAIEKENDESAIERVPQCEFLPTILNK